MTFDTIAFQCAGWQFWRYITSHLWNCCVLRNWVSWGVGVTCVLNWSFPVCLWKSLSTVVCHIDRNVNFTLHIFHFFLVFFFFFSTQSNDIQLLYFGREQIEPNRPQSISVPILEQYWQRQDGQSTNREHLIMALADVEAILVKATYTTNTREAAWVFSLCSFARHLWKIMNVYFVHFVLCVHLVRVLTIKML
jgi:hypothetical protein